jgi:hypothetical protein
MSILPYCMMPDGGDPCKGYAALKAERDRLTIIADAIQAERDRLRAALKRIANFYDPAFEGEETTHQEMARRALEGK